MKLSITGAVLLLAAMATSQQLGGMQFDRACDTTNFPYEAVSGCTTCWNFGPRCYTCSTNQVMAFNNQSCTDCSSVVSFCSRCHYPETDDTRTDFRCDSCVFEYYLDSTSGTTGECKPCTDNRCLVCPNDVCNVCEAGYVLANRTTGSGQDCVECPSNCESGKCKGGLGLALCDACRTGYYLSTAKTDCNACGSNCISCTESGCDTCATGFYLSGTTCNSCPSNCISCRSQGTGSRCEICRPGYALDSAGNRCQACPTNCQECEWSTADSKTNCKTCVSQKYAVDSNGDCVVCTSNCDECKDANDCSKCQAGYRLDTGLDCEACKPNCRNCDPDVDQCVVCEDRYTQGGSSETWPTCDACTSNCLTCNSGGCVTCMTGFYKENGLCKACGAGCNTCNSAGCLSTGCASGFAYNSNNRQCLPCPLNCSPSGSCMYDSAISATRCTTCEEGFIHDDVPRNCVPVQPGCLSANSEYNTTSTHSTSQTWCTSCEQYYELKDGLCELCPPYCPTCSWNVAGYFDCSTACANSNNATVMQAAASSLSLPYLDSAAPGYQNNAAITSGQTYCQPCHTGCQTCDATTLDCTVCFADLYALVGTSCESCPANCATGQCDFNTTIGLGYVECQACNSGYGVNVNKTACSDCTIVGGSGCTSCQQDPTDLTWDCLSCASGYKYDGANKKCDSCDPNCASCDANGATYCDSNQCTGAYYKDDKNRCKKCPSTCSLCNDIAASGDVTACTACVGGYVLDTDNNVCVECPSNCVTCSYDSSKKKAVCSDCVTGYGLNTDDDICQACPYQCSACTIEGGVAECTDCYSYYYKNSLVCHVCPPNCLECSKGISSTQKKHAVCSVCQEGYFINADGHCEACLSNCIKCDTAATCSECAVGYAKESGGTSCSSCSSIIANCATCEDASAKKCLTCASGYVLDSYNNACYSVNHATMKCNAYWDPPSMCTNCAGSYEVLPSGQCGVLCYFCDDTSMANCEMGGTNYTTVECLNQTECKMVRTRSNDNANFVRGCGVATNTCDDDYDDELGTSYQCQKVGDVETCVTCCKSEKCNDFSGSEAMRMSFVAMVTMLAAIFIL